MEGNDDAVLFLLPVDFGGIVKVHVVGEVLRHSSISSRCSVNASRTGSSKLPQLRRNRRREVPRQLLDRRLIRPLDHHPRQRLGPAIA